MVPLRRLVHEVSEGLGTRSNHSHMVEGLPGIRGALVICVVSPSGHADLTPGGGIESS
jgi:hypothetical protein